MLSDIGVGGSEWSRATIAALDEQMVVFMEGTPADVLPLNLLSLDMLVDTTIADLSLGLRLWTDDAWSELL